MCSTTKFDRVVTNFYNANIFPIFLTKEGHRSHFFDCSNISFNCFDWDFLPDLLINHVLNLLEVISSYLRYISYRQSPGLFIAGLAAGWFSAAAAFRTSSRSTLMPRDILAERKMGTAQAAAPTWATCSGE